MKYHTASPKLRLTILAAAIILSLSVKSGWSQPLPPPTDGTNNAPAVTKLSRTVGLDIVTNTVNPDKTVSLTYKWSEKGNTSTRTVIINDKTIVDYNGKLMKFADLTPSQLRAKSVATVGPDGVTTMLLRFGKKGLAKDQLSQLTPEQLQMMASLVPAATPASDAALNKRVSSLVASLGLNDPAKEKRVNAVITTDLKAVRDAHNAGLVLDDSVHTNFIAGLQADLTPEQVETVKDKLTINKVPITYRVYQQIVPNLKPEDKQYIMAELVKAREESLDEKNVDDMNPIFKKYKTEIQNYLDAHGFDWTKDYKTFVDAQKPGAATVDISSDGTDSKNSETNSTPATPAK